LTPISAVTTRQYCAFVPEKDSGRLSERGCRKRMK